MMGAMGGWERACDKGRNVRGHALQLSACGPKGAESAREGPRKVGVAENTGWRGQAWAQGTSREKRMGMGDAAGAVEPWEGWVSVYYVGPSEELH